MIEFNSHTNYQVHQESFYNCFEEVKLVCWISLLRKVIPPPQSYSQIASFSCTGQILVLTFSKWNNKQFIPSQSINLFPHIPSIHSLSSFPHSPSIHSLSPHSPSIHSLTFGIPSTHSLTFPQIPPIHSLNSFPHKSHSLTSHIPSQVTFPHKSHSLNSPHITSDPSNSFPQFTPSHSLNSFPRIPQFFPSIHSLTFGIPSIHSLTFPQIPPIHSLNLFPHKSHSLTSHVPSIPLTSPQIPPIHSLNSLLHIPSIHSLTSLNSFHQFIPSFPLNWILQFPQFIPSCPCPLNCSIESFIKYISPQFTPPYPHLVPNTPRFTVSQSNFSSFLLESWWTVQFKNFTQFATRTGFFAKGSLISVANELIIFSR